MTSRPTPEDVLAQAPWVRALARRLVSDAHLAEDLAQETMAAALERPPERALALRPWMARVLRNFLGQVARAEGRRRLREEVIARRAAEDPADRPDRVVEELALHRELTDAVLALDEPYRSTIVLRFLRELPPREIARRQGVPVKTVDSRIARGLARLRARLDRDAQGDSRAWVLSLATVLEAEPGLGLATPGVLLVNAKLVLSALSIAAVCAAAVWFGSSGPSGVGSGESLSAAAPPEAPRTLPAGPSARAASRPGRRAAVERPALTEPSAAAPAAGVVTYPVRGRVLDTEGAAVAGVPVGPVGAEERAVPSGAGGWFELESAAPATQLAAFDPRFVTVRRGVFSQHDEVAPAVVVAPALELCGVVVDEAGRPLDGARVRLEPPRGLDARIGWNLESSAPMGWSTASGGDGAFRFDSLPAIAGASLVAVLDGFEATLVPAPSSSQAGLELVLARPRVPLAGALCGRVVDPAGLPVPGARVALGLTSVLTDESGGFRLDLARAVTADTLRAVKPGFLPAIMDRPFAPRASSAGSDDDGAAAATDPRALGWPEQVELRLPGPALSIAGRVLDHRGEPAAGVRLWIVDPTPFGVIGRMPATLESLMGGAEVPPQALQEAALGPREDGDMFWDMHMPAGPSTAFWRWVQTAENGRFELDGLTRRSYRLKVMDDDTLTAHVSEPLRAGDHGVELRLPAPDVWPVLAGQVVAEDGTPLEGVRVRLGHEAYGDRSRVFGGNLEIGLHQARETVATDAEGRFRFEDVPRQQLYLALASNDIVPARHQLTGDEDAADLRVEVEARCHVEVLLERTPGAATLSVYDGDDHRLDVLRVAGESVSATTEIDVVDGASGVFSTSARAASLRVLGAGGEELARLPVRLVPGRVNLVRD